MNSMKKNIPPGAMVINHDWSLLDPRGYPTEKRTYEYTRDDLRFLSGMCNDLRESTLSGKLLSHLALCNKKVNVSPFTDKRPAHFFDVYDGLNIDREKEYGFLEIGNRWCGALWGWRVYLPNSKIFGLDIDEKTQVYSNDNPDIGVKVYEGDQTDVKLLKKIHKNAGKLDIIVDDGGHTMSQMKTSFETLWPLLEEGGIYIIEDTQCCYWPNHEGGYKVENSFMEDVKSFLDNIHSPFYKSESLKSARAKDLMVNEQSNYYDRSIESVEVHDSIVVVRKRKNIKDELTTRSVEHNFVQECLNTMVNTVESHESMGMEIGLTEDERDYYHQWWSKTDEKFCKYIDKKKEKMNSKEHAISFIIPSRNNLRYLKWCYNSIRKNLGYIHEICIADDASEDGTWEWLQKISKKDKGVKIHRNKGPERQGLVVLYDKLVKDYATNNVIMIFHADMYACPGLDTAIFEHLEKGTIVCATRVEPSLHPPGPEKIVSDYGIEPEEFDEQKFLNDLNKFRDSGKITNGIFAPWAIYKDDFWAVGGHDELFSPTSREDSDIFNRFLLNGCKFIQTWDGMVYHLTSRGSRFNSFSGGKPGEVNSKEWQYTNHKNIRNFIRKWGTNVNHDELMMPMVTPKYDIGFVVENCTEQILELLEPWCSTIYVDTYAEDYIKKETPNTLYDLNKRIYSIDAEKTNDIEVRFDGGKLTQNNFNYIQQLSEILANDELEVGSFELDIFEININKVKTYEKDLIICEH